MNRTTSLLLVLLAAAACAGEGRGQAPVLDRFRYPTGAALDPAGDTLWVVSTNFDVMYRYGTVLPVSLAAAETLIATATSPGPGKPPQVALTDASILPLGGAGVGSFAGDVAIAAADVGGRRVGVAGFVAVREGDAVQDFSIARQDDRPVPSCGEGQGVTVCGEDNTTWLGWVDPAGKEDTILSRDPFGLALSRDTDPEQALLYVGSLLDGTLDALTLDADWKPALAAHVQLAPGLHSIVEGPRVGDKRVVYASNRSTYVIHVVEVTRAADGKVNLVAGDAVVTNPSTATGDYFRGLALSKDMRRLFAAYRSPASLAVFDVDEAGSPSLRGLVPLAGGPSSVAVDPDSPAGAETVYAVDFAGDAVYVVDTGAMSVVHRIDVGDGPYRIVLGRAPVTGAARAWLPLFEEHAVSVVDLQPGSVTFRKEIARIK
jgi:YVTN family beta-propeller protein